MKVAGSYEFNAAPQQVWAVLTDPKVLINCIPGCERLDPTGEDEYEAVVNIGIGPVRGKYSAKIAMRDKVPNQSYVLVVEGTGTAGFMNGRTNITLEDKGETTTVVVDSDTQVGGAVARVGQRMMGSVAKSMLDRFFGCMQQAAK